MSICRIHYLHTRYTASKQSSHLILKLVLTFLFPSLFCYAEEYVGSHIFRDTRWGIEESPYIIERDLTVDKGANLSIAPGVKILIKKPKVYDTTVQYDYADSQFISIKVKGSLTCIGQPNNRIVFISSNPQSDTYGWYGIVFDRSADNFTEIAYTEISNAYRGISVRESSPVIRNLILEYNHIGIYCSKSGNAQIYNCDITRNLVAGIHVREANPHIANCIIAFNKNQGVLCDGLSQINFEYNCVYGNADGDYLDCNPELGIIVHDKKSKLQRDAAHNIYMDPIFAGSLADSISEERDITMPTEKSKIKNPALADAYYSEKEMINNEQPAKNIKIERKYELSVYSPCNNNGNPDAEFKNINGSRNTIGIWGGPKNIALKSSANDNNTSAAKPKKKSEKKSEKKKSESKH